MKVVVLCSGLRRNVKFSRHNHVVVVQRRQKNEQKSVMHVQSFCFANLKGLFTWSGGPRSSGVGFFCFQSLGDTKQKKPTPLNRGPLLHVNRI